MAFTMGRFEFKSRAAAVRAVSAAINAAPLGELLTGEAADLARACAEMHPAAAEKTARGVAGMVVRKIDYRPGITPRCFLIVHPDGGETSFSYRAAFGLVPAGPTVGEAARHAVWPGIVAYKTARYGKADSIPCDITGEPVIFADAHVDHAPPWPFTRILREWIASYGTPPLRDEVLRVVFEREDDATAFRVFHDERAVLRIVAKQVNMRKAVEARGA